MTLIIVPKHILPLINPKFKSLSQAIRELPYELIDKIYEFTKDYPKDFEKKFKKVLNLLIYRKRSIQYGYFFQCHQNYHEKDNLIWSLKKRFESVCCHHSLKDLNLQILRIPMYRYILYKKVFENKRKICSELSDCFDEIKTRHWMVSYSQYKHEKKDNWMMLKKVSGIPLYMSRRYNKITNKQIIEELKKKQNLFKEFYN